MIFFDFYDVKSGEYTGSGVGQNVPSIDYDYLNKNIFKINVPLITSKNTINDFDDNIVDIYVEGASKRSQHAFTGVCTKNEVGFINVQTIIDYIDCKFLPSEYNFKNTDIIATLKKIIEDKFVNNEDKYKNAAIEVIAKNTAVSTFYFESDIFTYTLKELVCDVFRQENIVINSSFNFEDNKMVLEIEKMSVDSVLDIDFKTFDAIDFSYSDIVQSTNKINLFEKIEDKTTGEITYKKINTYYLLIDGTRTTDPNAIGRFGNVVEETVVVEADKVDEFLDKNLIKSIYNSELTFRVLKKSKIYPNGDFIIGRKLNLFVDFFGIIETVVTELLFEENSIYFTVKCGTNRFDIVSLLKKEKIF